MLKKQNISPNTNKLILYLALVVVILAVYWHVPGYDFINYDDPVYVTENNIVKSGLTIDGIRWTFGTKLFGLWNPLVWLSFMLDHQIFGLQAGGYHVINLILHILSTLLLFWLLCRMTGAVWKSAFVAAVFALHPLHVESVAWISERKDVLSAFFWMLTLCLYVHYTQKQDVKRYLLVLGSFILALLSKPMVITLPIIMILLDYWPLNRFPSQKGHWLSWQVKEKLPFFVLSALMVIVTLYTPNEQEIFMRGLPLSSRLANAPVAFMTYLTKTFWPHNLAVFYPFPAQIPVWEIALTSLLIILISAAVMIGWKRLPYLFVGWLWYVITLVPVIGIIQIGDFAMADRYHYLPSIGIGIMLAWGIPSLLKNEQAKKMILFPAAIVFLALMVLLTWQQCAYWKNNIELWQHALKVTKNNYLAQNNLGLALFAKGKIDDALDHYNKAIGIKPTEIVPYQNKAIVYSKTGQYNLAIENYSKAIRLKRDNIDAYNNRGNAYEKAGNYELALHDFDKAIRLKPDYVDSYFNRANLYHKLGQYQKAVDDLDKVSQLNPDNYLIYYNRGNIYINFGRYQQAIDDFSQSIRLKPNNYEAYNNRAFIYLTFGRYEQAMGDYSKAIDLKPDYADAYNNRAFVYLNMGNVGSGCQDAKKACELGNCATLQVANSKGLCK